MERKIELFSKQEDFIFSPATFAAYGGGFGNGKCIRIGTYISLSDGSVKEIQDIISGDRVLTIDPETGTRISQLVINRIDVGQKKEWNVRLDNGLELSTTPEHPYYTILSKKKNNNHKFVDIAGFKELKDLNIGDSIGVLTKYPDGRRLYGENTAYLIGLLLGDGSISGGSVGFSTADSVVLHKIIELAKEYELTVKYKANYDYYLTSIPTRSAKGQFENCNKLINFLRELRLMGTKSETKFIPSQFFGATKSEIAALLSGLIVTDGWVDNNYLGYCSASEKLVDNIQQLMLRLGIMAGKCKKFVSYKGERRPYYYLQVSNKESIENCQRWLDILHKQSKLNLLVEKNKLKVARGRNKRLTFGDVTFVRITNIIQKQEVQMYDLEIENTHNFIANGIVAHNTLAGCIKAHQHCQQKDAFFLIGRRHATDLEDSTLRDFLELFRDMGKYSPGRKSFAFYKDGVRWSEVIFRHLDDMQSLTNMNLSGFWIDQAEETSEDAFDFLIGRIRRPVDRREGFITFNPGGHDWIWRRFLKHKSRDGKLLINASDYSLVMASTLENKKNLPESYIKGLLSQPESYIKRFVYGSFDTFSGQIFDEFSQELHVIQPFQIPNGWEKIRGIDHGQSGEHATGCLWMAIDYNGNCYMYQEYKKYDDIVSNHAKMINQLSKIRIDGQILDDHYSYTVIDPSTHAKNKVSKEGVSFSVADEYLDNGIATIGGQNNVIAGINRVKEYLKIDSEHYHPFKQEDGEPVRGAPHLYVFSSCTELIEEIQQYKWKQAFGVSTNSEADDIKERPRKKNDHLVDPLRYMIMSRPQSPQHMTSIAPWVFQNPIELARRAQSMGLTVDDLMAQRYGNTSLRHSTTGITHSGGISHSNSSVGHQTGL